MSDGIPVGGEEVKQKYTIIVIVMVIFMVLLSGCTSSGGIAVPEMPKLNLVIPVTQAPITFITPVPASTPTLPVLQNVTEPITTTPTAKSTYTIMYV